jgi:hypothetical protein
MQKYQYLDEIKRMRESKYLEHDPSLIAFMVRDWDVTEEAGLKDLCWALCRNDSYTHKNDIIPLLDDLEKFIMEKEKKCCLK